MNKIIGLIGLKRSGKDTCADHLCKNYGYIKYSFAEPLKKACMEMFGFSYEQVFGDAKDEIDSVWGCKPRDLLKIIGTEVAQYDLPKYVPEFQNIGRSIWVKRFEQWYTHQLSIAQNFNNSPTGRKIISEDPSQFWDFKVVISDVRFIHEAESIIKMGGEIWRIDRPGMNVGDFHASEKEMFDIQYDHYLENNGSLYDLYNKIDNRFLNI